METQEAIDLFYSLGKLSDILELSENDIVAKITMFDTDSFKKIQKAQEIYNEFAKTDYMERAKMLSKEKK